MIWRLGGRNYFKNSTPLRVIGGGNFQKNNENGVTFTANQATKTLFRLLNVIDSIGVWTVSFEAKANTPCSLFVDICDQNRTTHQLTMEFKKYITIGRPARIDNTYHFVDIETQAVATVEIKNIKIEKGTIATDWTPAPEDMAVDLSPYATNASINEFKQTQATKDTATTQKLSQLESGLNGKVNANALNTLTTKVNQVDGKITAQVSKVNTLQSTLNGQTASISQHSQTLNGLSAQYTIKVQTGGVVAGIGLASNNGVSDFSVRADKFYIASPQGQKGDTPFTVLTSPQVINGVQVPAGTYIKNAFIANGSITMAKIADSIQSDNYVQGRSGWRLYKNGELEINSSFGDGTRIQLNSRGLTGWYANGQKAFELGIFN